MKKITRLFLTLMLLTSLIRVNAQNITGSGTSNYLPVFLTSTTVGNSIVYYNKTISGIGISTDNPLTKLHVEGNFQAGRGLSKFAIGSATGNAIGYGTSYLGFNARRNSDNTWTIDSDGANSGGGIIYGNVGGSIMFTPIKNAGNITQRPTDDDIYKMKCVTISPDANLGIGTRNPKASLEIRQLCPEYPDQPFILVHAPGEACDPDMRTPFKVTAKATYINQYDFNEPSAGLKDASLVVNGRIGIDFGSTNPDREWMYMTSTGGFIYSHLVKEAAFKNENEYMNLKLGGISIISDPVYGKMSAKITNDGKIWAQQIVVQQLDPWPDFVFGSDYDLMKLNKLEQYVKENNHLPQVPSAADVANNGMNVGEMNALLLQKIEELTLYVIELNKEIETLKSK